MEKLDVDTPTTANEREGRPSGPSKTGEMGSPSKGSGTIAEVVEATLEAEAVGTVTSIQEERASRTSELSVQSWVESGNGPGKVRAVENRHLWDLTSLELAELKRCA